MYLSDKPQPQPESAVDFYTTNKLEAPHHNSNMIIQLPPQSHHHIAEGGATTPSGGDDTPINHNSANPSPSCAPKKRAETWVQEETRVLISLRKEIDMLFNTSKSNKHLWDNISLKMREKGFDRSPTMCTDKWRNLLKEFKKAKQNHQDGNGSGSAKMNYYKDIEEILSERNKNGPTWKNSEVPNGSKVDSFMQFADKGLNLFSSFLSSMWLRGLLLLWERWRYGSLFCLISWFISAESSYSLWLPFSLYVLGFPFSCGVDFFFLVVSIDQMRELNNYGTGDFLQLLSYVVWATLNLKVVS